MSADDVDDAGNPFEDVDMGDGPDADATPDREGLYGMLRSSEPPVTPEEIGRELDIGAEWWQHYGAAFVKMTGSSGTEAWMHLVMGTALLLLGTGDDDSEGIMPAPDNEEPEGAEDGTFQGPQ